MSIQRQSDAYQEGDLCVVSSGGMYQASKPLQDCGVEEGTITL